MTPMTAIAAKDAKPSPMFCLVQRVLPPLLETQFVTSATIENNVIEIPSVMGSS